MFNYKAITSPTTPESPARTRFWPAPATAPLLSVEFEAVDVAAEPEAPVPVADDEAEVPVSEGPDAADPLGSAVPEVAEEPVAVAVSAAVIFSRPAVIVTGKKVSEMPLNAPIIVPGLLASGPATV